MTNNNITPDPVTMDGLVERRVAYVAKEQDELEEYIAAYEMCCDDGYYTPNENERGLIQDALQGWVWRHAELFDVPALQHENATLLATIAAKDEALAVVAGGDADVSDTAIIVGNGAATVMRQIRKALEGHSHE